MVGLKKCYGKSLLKWMMAIGWRTLKMDQVKVSGEIGHELFQEMFPKYPMVGLSSF